MSDKIGQLKMTAQDGKNASPTPPIPSNFCVSFNLIPFKKAEPFKLCLARVGRERIEETIDPELTIERALETYLRKGYS